MQAVRERDKALARIQVERICRENQELRHKVLYLQNVENVLEFYKELAQSGMDAHSLTFDLAQLRESYARLEAAS